MKKTLLSILAIAAMLGATHFAAAQTATKSASESGKPMATIAFSGYNELKGDLEMIGKLGDNPNIAQGLEMGIMLMTQGEGLAAIDTKKPWGAIVVPAPGMPQVLVFLPVTSMDKFIGLLEKFGMEPKDQGDGVYAIESPGGTITLKKSGDFALVANGEEALKAAPSDPIKALGGLEKKYDIAVRMSVRNVPEDYKKLAINNLKLLSEAGMVRQPGEEDDEAYQARVAIAKQSLQNLIDLINETDDALLGLSIDQKTQSAYLDFAVTAIAGTKLAKQCAAWADVKTSFAGVTLPGAAIKANWAMGITDDQVVQAKNGFKQIRAGMVKDLEKQDLEEGNRELAKRLITDLFGVIEKTLDAKKADGGMSVVMEPEALKFAFAGAVAEGATLEKALKDAAPEIEKKSPGVKVKLNAETYKTVRLHTISIPLPKDDEDAAKVAKFVGKSFELVLGVSDAAVYVAGGRDAMKTIKTVIDSPKTPKAVPPLAVSIALTPIMKFAAAAAEDNPQTQMVSKMICDMLEKSSGNDHVTITGKSIPNGQFIRVELEQGILALIGGAGKMAGGPGMAPGELQLEPEDSDADQ